MDRLAIVVIVVLTLAGSARAAAAQGIGMARATFVDASRPTKASPPFGGAPDRRLDTWIWYPADVDGDDPVENAPAQTAGIPWPLGIFSHGTYSRPDSSTHFCEHLARSGYVVAAPSFPLTSRTAHTALPAADVSDAGSHSRSVSCANALLLS